MPNWFWWLVGAVLTGLVLWGGWCAWMIISAIRRMH